MILISSSKPRSFSSVLRQNGHMSQVRLHLYRSLCPATSGILRLPPAVLNVLFIPQNDRFQNCQSEFSAPWANIGASSSSSYYVSLFPLIFVDSMSITIFSVLFLSNIACCDAFFYL